MASSTNSGAKVMSGGNIYLVFYNVFQFLGWCMILIQTFSQIFYHGFDSKGLWNETRVCLMIFQTLAWLEVLHCACKLVQSSAMTTAIQVFSRNFILWAIVLSFKDAQSSYALGRRISASAGPLQYLLYLSRNDGAVSAWNVQLSGWYQCNESIPLILIAWSVTEVIRYSFYFMNILYQAPYFLTYLRYTLFYALYPMGVTGEQLCLFSALPAMKSSKMYSMELPNKWNFAFSFYYFSILVILSYLPFFPQLYCYMISQRKKVLGGKMAKKRE